MISSLVVLRLKGFQSCFYFFAAGVEYIHGCPSKVLGQGSWSDEKWNSHFDSTENQPDTLISLNKAPVSCCNDNGECTRIRPSVDRGLWDTITGVVDNLVDVVEEVVENVVDEVTDWLNDIQEGECFPYDANFTEAEGICNQLGQRLCRSDEINNGNCCGVGCQFDRHYTWVDNSKYLK